MKNIRLNTILFGMAVMMVSSAFAQTDSPADTSYWKKGGTGTLTFSNVSLSNWAAGGQNSVSLNSYLGLYANYTRDRKSWENTLNLGYGLLKQESNGYVKSDDKINLTTKYGYRLSKDDGRWYMSALLDFKTQFTDGLNAEDSVISKFMAPGYLVVATGIDYKIGEVFSASLAPVSGKFTYVNDDALSSLGAYGVDPGSKLRSELGVFFRMRYVNEIISNVNYETRVELFSNYIENFGTIDVNWENIFLLKVNDFLSASFTAQLIYDEDVKVGIDNNGDNIIDEQKAKVQFKTVFGFGLTYVFGGNN